MKRRITAWGAAGAAVVAAVFVAPADAHAAFSDCPANVFCLWVDPDGGGYGIAANGDLPDLRVQNLNDSVSSVVNNSTTRGICLYPDLNFDGAWAAYVPAWTWANITDPGANDQATSVQWAPSDNPPGCWTASAAAKKNAGTTHTLSSAHPLGH